MFNTTIKNIYHYIDAQAFGGWNGCKDLIVDGGEFEASGETVMFGGADSENVNMIPQDILIQDALLTKNLEWRKKLNGETCKNLLEIKQVKRFTMKRCKGKYSWGDGQEGPAIVLHNRQNPHPYSTIEDVLIEDCEWDEIGAGVNILGRDYEGMLPEDDFMKRVKIVRNKFTNFDAEKWSGSGRQIVMQGHTEDVQFLGNSFDGANFLTAMTFGWMGELHDRLVLIGNTFDEGQYGIHGEGAPSLGKAVLDMYAPGYTWLNNTIKNMSGGIPYP